MLYVCATPIGNLDDITYRVVKTLRDVDIIAAEDTRHSAILLNHFDIKKPLLSYHEHNEKSCGEKIISLLKEGKKVALISDAGMPCISDPGSELVKLCIENNLDFEVLPGASACLTALCCSGLKMNKFFFEGFLPAKKNDRIKRLGDIKFFENTLIFYESPHRLKKFLQDAHDILGDRTCSISRELTKKYEETLRFSLSEAVEYYNTKEPRGEFVVIVEGYKKIDPVEIDILTEFNKLLEMGYDKKTALKELAKSSNFTRRELYDLLMK